MILILFINVTVIDATSILPITRTSMLAPQFLKLDQLRTFFSFTGVYANRYPFQSPQLASNSHTWFQHLRNSACKIETSWSDIPN